MAAGATPHSQAGPPAAAESEAANATGEQELLQTLLSWDYLDVCERMSQGKGVLDDLQPVPASFDSVQVPHDA